MQTLRAMLSAKSIHTQDFDGIQYIFSLSSGDSGLFNYIRPQIVGSEGQIISRARLWNGLERMYTELWPYFSLDGEKLTGLVYDGELDDGLTALYEAGVDAISMDKAHHHPNRKSFHGFFVKAGDDAGRILKN